MSEPKHTPKPWRLGKSKLTIMGKGGKIVAAVDSSVSNVPDDQRDANARLIAAAPELLAACEQSLKWLKIDRDAGLISDDVYHVRRETILAAIAKATSAN